MAVAGPFLLVKNLPTNAAAAEVLRALEAPHDAELLAPGETSAYVQFAGGETAAALVARAAERSVWLRGRRLQLCLVDKLPLDLNAPGPVVLLTFYRERAPIDIGTLAALLAPYGPLLRASVFRKKNFQALVELGDAAAAARLRAAVDGRELGGLCLVRAQFTRKESIVVRVNNALEHDWTGEAPKPASNASTRADSDSDSEDSRLEALFRSPPISPRAASPPIASASAALRVGGLAPTATQRHVFNLFSLYGSIRRIDAGAATDELLVQFDSATEAATAMYYLDGVSLFGRALSVESGEATGGASRYRRGKSRVDFGQKQRTMSRPAAALYLFNLDGRVALDELRAAVEREAPIVDLRFVNASQSSALCTFASVEAAVRVLCALKNTRIGAVTLKANFANEQLNRARTPLNSA